MLYGGTLLKGTQIASSDWKKAWDTCKKKNKKSPAKSCLDALSSRKIIRTARMKEENPEPYHLPNKFNYLGIPYVRSSIFL